MKSKLGIFLTVALAATTLWLNAFVALFSFGIVVMSDYSLESADDIVAGILKTFVFTFLLSIVLQFLVAKYLLLAKRSLLVSLTISLFLFAGSVPFIFAERAAFMENGRPQALDIDTKNISEIRSTDLRTGKTQLIDPKNRENIWSLERQINKPPGKMELMKGAKYKTEIYFRSGQVVFITDREPDHKYVTL